MPIQISEAIKTLTATGSGRARIRIIDAGVGSSGTYPAVTLERAASERVFPAGTHIYMDHPDKLQAEARPERSVRDLIGTTTADASYDEDTQALEADAKFYEPYRAIIDEMKDDVGMSIRAYAESTDSVNGPIITRITEGLSIDVVTHAGRGGKILAILESARVSEASANDRREQLRRAVAAKYPPDQDNYRFMWLRDFDDAQRVVWYEDREDRTWQDTYTVSDDDLSATLDGAPTEVRPVTTYVPVDQAGQTTTQEARMPQIEESRLAELEQAAARAATLEADLAAANERATLAEAAQAQSARRSAIAEAIGKIDRPAPFRARVAATLEATDDDISDSVVEAAVKAEDAYLAAIVPDKVTGFGKSGATEAKRRTRDAWGAEIKER